MNAYDYTLWIFVLPFLSFVITGLLKGRIKASLTGLIATSVIGISTVLSYLTAYKYFIVNKSTPYVAVEAMSTTWLRFSQMDVDFGILLDPISVMMLVVITTVSFMVHIYSTGYMKGDPGYSRYFSFLSLFSFSMLGLVISTNLIQMYIFWELVGVSSFLLIGYYYQKPSAVAAAKKAFIVTRFADFGFLVGILILSNYAGTFNFIDLTDPNGILITQPIGASFMGISVLVWALILIFMGGAGKSAMFPFHIWLPDAMEGPTPVSALIHAATMVVAGVYLVARMFPVFSLGAPEALGVVAFIGAFTSLFAAIIATTQRDIKKILAYSTISQIGYMMLALGVSGYGGEQGLGFTASMFHLFTHAFFKALLFLGAGSIIHAVHTNYMDEMGGLRKHMPATHITFLIACLAISGIPPLAGFFSKDEILVAAYQSNMTYFVVEYLVAGLTSFYMFRLYFRVFWNKEPAYKHTPHESPNSMVIPMVILSLGAAFTGFIHFSGFVTSDGAAFDSHIHWNIAIAAIAIAIIGIGVAWKLYASSSDLSSRISKSLGAIYTVAKDKFYIDEVYIFITKKIIFNLVSRPIAWFDRHIVDGTMNLIGNGTVAISYRIRKFQSGNLHQYAFMFGVGVLIATAIYLYFITA